MKFYELMGSGILVPYLGLIKSAFMFGVLNTMVALWIMYLLKEKIPNLASLKFSAIMVLLLLMFGFVYSSKIMSVAEAENYSGSVIFARSTPYQRLVLTKQKNDLRLFINSNLQFSSVDEYRYHEALVHPALSAIKNPKNILIIGGGDGLALREVLKYDAVEAVTLVDLDPEMTRLFSASEILTELNGQSLLSPKLTVKNSDAFLWLKELTEKSPTARFDAIIVDVPDPSNFSIGKLYSLTFFKLLNRVVKEDGIIVVQSTSPLFARKSFWCINNTLAVADFYTTPYHAYVPSFGEWGFVIATKQPYIEPKSYPKNLRYISTQTMKEMLNFPADMSFVETEIQRLDDQVLIRYFDEEWSQYLSY